MSQLIGHVATGEKTRIELRKNEGRFDLRHWYFSEVDGAWHPTKKGIHGTTVAFRKVQQLMTDAMETHPELKGE